MQPFKKPEASGVASAEARSEAARLREAGIELDPELVRRNRLVNAWSVAVPLAGTLAAFASLFWLAPSAATWWVFFASFIANALGIGVGLHRYFTHKSFTAHPAVEWFLGVTGSWALQGPIARWVADHRRHHRYTDARFDPHSPYWNDDGPIASVMHGWAHSHFLWMFRGLPSSQTRYAADIHAGPIAGFCTRHYWKLAATGLIAPAIAGALIGGAEEALLCFLWAGCFRVAALHHISWSVNSLGHRWGGKVEGAPNEARDNLVLAILLLGEGLHSFHHRYSATAVNRPLALDFGGMVILALERLGLVTAVRRYDLVR